MVLGILGPINVRQGDAGLCLLRDVLVWMLEFWLGSFAYSERQLLPQWPLVSPELHPSPSVR